MFQEFRLLDHLTTYDNVALPLRIAGAREAGYRADVMELLSWVGLADQARAYPPVLSGGEKQRAAIARAVIAKPELLLADEPTGNVDPALADRLLRLFVELNRLGTTVLIATHDTHLIAAGEMPVLPARARRIADGGMSKAEAHRAGADHSAAGCAAQDTDGGHDGDVLSRLPGHRRARFSSTAPSTTGPAVSPAK